MKRALAILFAAFAVVILLAAGGGILYQRSHGVDLLASRSVFKLGMARDDVHKMAGAPVDEWDSPSGIVWEIYNRRTSTNEYKISVTYEPDQSQSMLHPIWRLSYVKFELDHPRPLAEVMDDIPEAREVCPKGCDIAVGTGSGDLVAAPAKAPAWVPMFFTVGEFQQSVSQPVSTLCLSKSSSPAFEYSKSPTSKWYPAPSGR